MKAAKLTSFMKSRKGLILIVLVIVVGSIAVIAVTRNKSVSGGEVVTHSTNEPSEEKPDKNTYKWQGQPSDPKYITLPTIKSEGFVQKAGVDQNNEIAVPNNIHMAAWFVDSESPGQPGLSVIDGHVNGRVNNGIFKDLNQLKKDDEFTVELGNGEIKKYRVMENVTVPTKDAVSVLFSQNPKVKSQLNLITCGGTFDKKTQKYDKRVIVSGELVD